MVLAVLKFVDEIIVSQAMHTHVARRARSEAAREADFDEHRADVRGFGCDGCDGRDYAYAYKYARCA